MKTCSKCGRELPCERFYKRPSSRDGLRGDCKDCCNKRHRRYVEANSERVAAYKRALYVGDIENQRRIRREWAAANLDRKRAADRALYERKAESRIEAAKQWAIRNPERARLYGLHRNSRRRARIRNAYVERVNSVRIYERDDGICHLCGGHVEVWDASLDHVVPLSRGGEHSERNVRLAHLACNQKRGARWIPAEDELSA